MSGGLVGVVGEGGGESDSTDDVEVDSKGLDVGKGGSGCRSFPLLVATVLSTADRALEPGFMQVKYSPSTTQRLSMSSSCCCCCVQLPSSDEKLVLLLLVMLMGLLLESQLSLLSLLFNR